MALVNVERDRRFFYGDFHRLTNRIANAMRNALLLRRGDLYLNILHNDNLPLVHVPTILKGDATAIFCNIRDSLDVHAWQVAYTKPKVVLIENELLASHLAMLRSHGVTVVCMDPLREPCEGVLYFWDLIQNASEETPNTVLDDRDHIALIRFTGGTTGTSKPAMYTPDNLFSVRDSFFALDDTDWSPRTRILHVAPVSHGSGLFLIAGLMSGACNVTLNEANLAEFCRVVERERATCTFVVPTLLYRLLDLAEATNSDLSSLQNIFYGAAPMSPGRLKQLQGRFGNNFVQLYAATENYCIALQLNKAAHRAESQEQERRLGAAGRPVAGVEIAIMDSQGAPVEIGKVGELWLRSRGTISGYYKNPEQTELEFVDGFWKSGDMGFMDADGFVYLVDRKKDLIISGGFNIYPSEVEMVINSHEAVLVSAVVGIPHEDWGEAVHAAVVLREGMAIDEDELITFVKVRLGSYKAPKSLAIVSELPMTPAGKVLRRTVRDQYWKDQSRNIG